MLDKTDIPAALDNLNERLTVLEQAKAETQPSPQGSDPRIDDIETVLERYFGKEIADARAARTSQASAVPATPAPTPNASAGVNVTPGPASA